MTIHMIRVATLVVIVTVTAATGLAQSAPPPRQTPAADYRIGANDVLTINVWNEKDLSGDVTVRPDGKIALKIGNEITALGLRPDELKTRVMEELSKFFKPVPEVYIQVKQINSRMKLTPAAAALQPSPPMLEVSGPTYFADGEIRGGTAGRMLKLNEPIEIFQASGKTLCESSSATTGIPTSAGAGWRLRITPVSLTNEEVVLQLEWQRLWERGAALTNGPKGSAVVTLQPGKRILLDYISAGDLVGPNHGIASRPGDPNRPAVRYSPGCNAIGMGLQIGLPPVESQTFVEANLWLVRTLADGSERVWPQTVRIRTGTVAEFVFDDQTIALNAPKPVRGDPALEDARKALAELKGRGVLPTHPTYRRAEAMVRDLERLVKEMEAQPQKDSPSTAERRVRTSGKLRSVGVSDGKVMMEVTLGQYLVERPGSADRISGGSATFDLTAGPEEVVAFRLPQVADEAGRMGERMSVRVQVKAINR